MKIRVFLLVFVLLIILAGCNSQFISSGIIYMQQNELEKAVKQFQLAIDNEPNNPQTYLWMGKAYGEMKEYEKASSYFIQALEKDTADAVIKEMRENYEFFWAILFNAGIDFKKNGDAKEKLGDYEKYLLTANLVKDTFMNYDYLVILYSEVGNEKKMIDAYNKSIKKNPDNIATIFNMAKYYINSKDYSTAKNYLEKAKQIDESNLNISFYLASIYQAMGKKDSAIDEFTKMEKFYSQMNDENKKIYKDIYFEALFRMGNIYYEKKNYKNAIIYYDKAHQVDEDDVNVIQLLAFAYYRVLNYSKAIDAIELYFEKGGDESSNIYLIKFDCYKRLGKESKALEMYKKYEELQKQGK